MPGATTAIRLYPQATPTPIAISVNIFRLRFTTDCQPRTSNGQPHHMTTGVASASSIHPRSAGLSQCPKPGIACPMAMTTSGAVSTKLIQNRRVMSRSSGSSSSSAVTVSGSRAMPQIGQLPGRSLMTCGCIGQVY